MADDGDNKENIQNNGKSDKTVDLQVLNDVKSILAQVTATNNPAELSRLVSQAQSLKSDNPAISEIIEKVQSAVTKKQENAETQLNSNINSDNSELQKQLDREIEAQKLLQDQEAIHQEHERLKIQHQQFLKDTDELIEKKQKEIEGLRAINAKFAAGEEVTEADLDKFIKTPKEVEEEKQKWEAAQKHSIEATKNHEAALAHQEKLQQEKIKLEKELEEKLKAVKNPERPTEKEQADINATKKHLDQHTQTIQKHEKAVEGTKVVKEEALGQFSKMKNQRLELKTEQEKLRQNVDQLKQVDSNKHQKLSNRLAPIKNQEKIINVNIQDKNPQQGAQNSSNITAPKKISSFDELFNLEEEKVISINKAQDNKQQVNTSEKSDISKDITSAQEVPVSKNKQNSTKLSSTNGDIMLEAKDQLEKNSTLKFSQELKDKAVAIAKNIISKVEMVFVNGGVSAVASKGPTVGAAVSKKKDGSPAR